MTSAEIRQSFLDFFKSKGHTIVPSSSLMPDSPNLLFTNAGMNQFVPIFLAQRPPDVSKWPGAVPGRDTRAADTQKCIRAGGKHNDLEDVGLDTYHHTFFEMLGNWSFGDYFKKEAIEWAWELVTEVWKFPKNRLYATVYSPDKTKGDPSDFDQEAYDLWAAKFRAAGLDPKIHIVSGNKKDNFWMMGDTGPCGPCSEIHFDLTPEGNTQGRLVNTGDARSIEIWNLVFIQFNANPDGTFSPLPAKHVDTGMGFERLTSFIQCTRNFTDFTGAISNYETDVFRPIFDKLEHLSGKKYRSTLPGKPENSPGNDKFTPADAKSSPADADFKGANAEFKPADDEFKGENAKFKPAIGEFKGENAEYKPAIGEFKPANDEFKGENAECKGEDAASQVALDIAFRVIADHIRTLSFAIADGILPSNEGRGYVLRRILRRAVRYGRTLGFHEPFFYKLVSVLADKMGHVFPALRAKEEHVEKVIQRDEERFNKTLDNGIERFASLLAASVRDHILAHAYPGPIVLDGVGVHAGFNASRPGPTVYIDVEKGFSKELQQMGLPVLATFPGAAAFELYDTYGFPLDLTELMARERGMVVDKEGFDQLMKKQKEQSQAARKKQVIKLSEVETTTPTQFVGYDKLESPAKVLEVIGIKDKTAVILDTSPLYAEMGGQVGDSGELAAGPDLWHISNTQKNGNTWLHFLDENGPCTTQDEPSLAVGSSVTLTVDRPRRHSIQRHHTVTHLLHWALHEVVSQDAVQKGSYVGPEKLTFDFSSAPLTPQQVADVEKLVNERILENAAVAWTEIPYADAKARKDIMQFFGEKYGERVRVVQIGGGAGELNGYSMELCGGTHTRATGEIGLFRVVAESAIAAGIRRIEAVSGLEAYKKANEELQLIKTLSGKVNSPVGELEKKIESLLAQQKDLEKQLKAAQQKQAADIARRLADAARNTQHATQNTPPAVIENLGTGDGDFLQTVADALKGQFKGVVVLAAAANGAVALVATVSPEFTKQIQAGKIIQTIAPIVGGKGGGRPDNARGGGKEVGKLDEALAKARTLLG
jgi:alanyl-tRNA synthetase